MFRASQPKGVSGLPCKAFKLPDHQCREGWMRVRFFGICIVIACLTGCVQQAMTMVDAPCDPITPLTQRALCYSKAESPLWAKYYPESFNAFQAYDRRRYELSQWYDAGQITEQQYMGSIQTALFTLRQVADATNVNSDQDSQEWLSKALSAYAIARFGGSSNTQPVYTQPQRPLVQHTNCQRNPITPSQIECTTLNF